MSISKQRNKPKKSTVYTAKVFNFFTSGDCHFSTHLGCFPFLPLPCRWICWSISISIFTAAPFLSFLFSTMFLFHACLTLAVLIATIASKPMPTPGKPANPPISGPLFELGVGCQSLAIQSNKFNTYICVRPDGSVWQSTTLDASCVFVPKVDNNQNVWLRAFESVNGHLTYLSAQPGRNNRAMIMFTTGNTGDWERVCHVLIYVVVYIVL